MVLAFIDLSQIPLLRHLHLFGANKCTIAVNFRLLGLFQANLPVFAYPT